MSRLKARLVRRPVVTPGDWARDLHPVLARVYAMRGAASMAQAQPKLAHLHPPHTMAGLDAATALLADAIVTDAHIVVVGDFDCDGATACAVGVRGLRMLGARRVSYAVPNRIVHGYGLTPAMVDELAPMAPDLVVTVDHGIACHAGVSAAKGRGWKVLVTDHHLPGESLPPADAIVDPNVHGDGFASKSLAGVGVIFYVLLALRRHLRDRGAYPAAAEPDLSQLLDLVAVGTVADLVALDPNNRALVAAGLRRMRAGQVCAGLRALAEVAQRDLARVSASDIGYAIAPRINAAGRLEDMSLGIECLLTDELPRAREIAAMLNEINGERRAVQQQMVEEAERALSRVELPDGDLPPTICLFDADWHPGVVGLVASKLKERLHRPVVAFAPAAPGSPMLRGSARSIPGFHIRDALATVASRRPSLIERFGGNAMAAGLSLAAEHFDTFTTALHTAAVDALTPDLLQAEILSDGELSPAELGRACAEAIRDGGPWGQAFPEPHFDGEFQVLSTRIVGQRHLRMELGVGAVRVNAIEFGGAADPPGARVRIAYRLEPDDYRGGDAVQLVVVHREPA